MTSKSKFTPEFKKQAVQLALTSDRSRRDIARDLEINESTLRRWVREDKENNPRIDPNETPEQELIRLRKENEQLRLEHDILKKATAFFARESQ